MVDKYSENMSFESNNEDDQSNKPLPSFIKAFSKYAWSKTLKSDKQTNENTKDVEPCLSRRMSGKCKKGRIDIQKEYTNESNVCLEEIVDKQATERTALINNMEISRKNKQTEENTKNEASGLLEQTSKSCTKEREDSEQFGSNNVFNRHIAENSYLCDYKECNKSFKSKTGLRYHKETHTDIYPYKCGYEGCDKKFRRKDHLSIHITMHTGEKKYKCDYCPNRFSRKNHMQRHMREVHSGEKKYKCDYCPIIFSRKCSMQRHVNTIHLEEKKYKCDYCTKRFSDKSNVQRHVRKVHSGEKKYKCDYCTKRFSDKSNMQTHMNTIHSEGKKYKCDYCPKRFSQKGNMQRHVNTIHLEEKKYKCDYCPNRFSQKIHMQRHVSRMHSGETPEKYNCNRCQKCFSTSTDLKRHDYCIRKKNHSCDSFKRKDHLKQQKR